MLYIDNTLCEFNVFTSLIISILNHARNLYIPLSFIDYTYLPPIPTYLPILSPANMYESDFVVTNNVIIKLLNIAVMLCYKF